MTPSPLEEAQSRVRTAAASLQLATQSGRVELREIGGIAEATWELADHLAGELIERLGELERAESLDRRRLAAGGGGGDD